MHLRDPGEGLLVLPQDGARIDRLDAQRKRPEWLSEVWSTPGTRVLRLYGRRARLSGNRLDYEEATGPLPEGAVALGAVDPAELPDGAASNGVSGSRGGAAALVHVVTVAHPKPADEHVAAGTTGTTWADLAFAGSQLTPLDAALLTQALAITAWHVGTRFCASCGTATEVEVSGWRRVCPHCGAQTFPRTDPAVITAVLDSDDRILLGSAHRWDTCRYSTFAGFVEAGESVEAALAREIEEEAGVVVSDIRYMGSQSWPFPRSLMLGHFAVARDPSVARPDGDEIRDVRWFTRAELTEAAEAGEVTLPTRSSISRALIERWHGTLINAVSDAQPRPAPSRANTGSTNGRPGQRGQQPR
ncbi:NAD(+) diphosphatase [Nesterenkonia sp. LB17]|uniref:NAD(+) diphosphatase n=1 Tax=unclassified Nesterenkonia TaxID=2629769 RepID=UPI001F4D304D|nr:MULTISPECIES: NAD(+) diphosphatase [unclassified Nesterenkonia]MCH8564426.1 NAD(+) diphosphatase [Nesterenkonia sp. LB17]MCH8570052.1 NAD(+) diphosphatase [Nesterenkonia sp. AY15]